MNEEALVKSAQEGDDEALVKSAQEGDDEAFYNLITIYKDKLFSIAYCFLKDEQDSLEAVQEVTCRAYIKLAKLKEPQYFMTWLTRIMINYCKDELKRRKKVVLIEKENVIEEVNGGINSIELESVIEKLRPKYKEVIVLKYFQNMTVTEIAGIMKCPEGAVKTWTSRALQQLKDMLNIGGESGA